LHGPSIHPVCPEISLDDGQLAVRSRCKRFYQDLVPI
jgi:hypothetical protein